MLQKDKEMDRTLREMCQKVKRYENMRQTSMRLVTHVCTKHLAKNLTRLQDRLLALFQRVDELSGHAHKQLGSLYTAEVRLHKMDNWFADSAACHVFRQVNIDIQLRACAGSCRSSEPFGADHRGYCALESDMEQLE